MDRKSDTNRILQNLGHRKPVTRREFLGQGFLAGLGMATLPTFAQMLDPRRAEAQLNCQLAANGGMIPFICIDLAGGANIAGSNVVVGGNGAGIFGDQLNFISPGGYSKLGLPAQQTPDRAGQIDQSMDIAFHIDSAFLRGIQARVTPSTLDTVNGTIICARSDNDTGNNPHNPMYGINAAGASGDLVALIGTENTESGGNSLAPMSMIDPTVRPTKVDRPSDATGLVDTGRLVQLLSQQDAGEVMRAVEDLSALKLDRTAEEDALKELILCNYVKTTDQVSRFGSPDQLDPLQDAAIVGQVDSIFTAADLGNSRYSKTASVMKLVVGGLAGAGTLEFGGYDYHDGTRATGEIRDFQAGEAIGAVLEYAARMVTPVMIYVFSDGSLASDGVVDNSNDGRGKGVWRGDNSSTAASLMLAYHPTVRPAVQTHQIGYFRDSGDVETSANRIANDVNLLTEAVVMNYLALHGREGEIGSILPMNGLGSVAERAALTSLTQIV